MELIISESPTAPLVDSSVGHGRVALPPAIAENADAAAAAACAFPFEYDNEPKCKS